MSIRSSARLMLIALAALLTSAAFAQIQHAQPDLTGFAAHRLEQQYRAETRLQELPSPETFREHLRRLTAEPHVAGTPENRRVADYIAEVMRSAGLAVEFFDYDVYLPPGPGEIDVAIVTPIRLPLNNQEYILREDRFSGHPRLLPGWNAYSGSGDVTAEVVYANYGRKEDFEKLAELGISVAGKIVIARYGGNFRGYKAKYAEAAGAVGLLIFSDPSNGGYTSGPPYPEDRYLNESTVQRGSVLTLDYTGDPLTPFEPAYPLDSGKKVKRLRHEEVAFHTIPVTPLPYGAAQEILRRMDGQPAPRPWQGGLPFTYRLNGGSDLTVRVRVDQPFALTRITNVVGTLNGSELPDEWIILGSHYDAWGFGAVDPNGGTAMLLTLAQALGQLAADGMSPRRTIKIAHWDAEEFGIIGSSEWVEQHRAALMAKTIAYINADGAVSGGRFSASASPSLKQLIIDAARAVTYPETEITVFQRWLEQSGPQPEVQLGNLGGGSDHVGFYSHAAIPSAGVSMGGSSPIYHSNYDNFAWYERFGDDKFIYGPALARVDGILTLRLANADLLPYDVQRYPADLAGHVEALQKRVVSQKLTVDFSGLTGAIERLAATAAQFEAARRGALNAGNHRDGDFKGINARLIGLEKAFINPDGLPFGRWNRSLYASPDPFSGYASWMLPGLRYGIETNDEQLVLQWLPVYLKAIQNLNQRIEEIIALVENMQ